MDRAAPRSLRQSPGWRARKQTSRAVATCAPHQRLAIGERQLPSDFHAGLLKGAQTASVALRRTPRAFTRRALEHTRRQVSRRQRATRGIGEPFAPQIGPRDQRQCQCIRVNCAAERKRERQRQARAHRRARQRAATLGGQRRGQHDEGFSVALVQAREHLPAELAPLRTDGDGRRQLVHGCCRSWRRQPVEVAQQVVLERRAHRLEQQRRIHAFERHRLLLQRDARERGHGLAPERAALLFVVDAQARAARQRTVVLSFRPSHAFRRSPRPALRLEPSSPGSRSASRSRNGTSTPAIASRRNALLVFTMPGRSR